MGEELWDAKTSQAVMTWSSRPKFLRVAEARARSITDSKEEFGSSTRRFLSAKIRKSTDGRRNLRQAH